MKICKCGCGKEVINEKNNFLRGHGSKKYETRLKMSRSASKRISSEETKLKISRSNIGKKLSDETKLKISIFNTGKKLSNETKLKISKSCTGYKHTKEAKLKIAIRSQNITKETRLKLSLNHKGMTGKKHTLESRSKMSISAIKYINKYLDNSKRVVPSIGSNELQIINQIENTFDIKGISNDYDLFLKCGKWPDRYYEKYNLCVDILEPHHFKVTGELSDNDQNRELIVAGKLGCMIYYIPEQEFLKNPEKEIQRLKDFLVLLDEGVN